MIRRPPRSTLFPYRRSSDLTLLERGAERRQRLRGPNGPLPGDGAALHRERLGRALVQVRSEEHTSELQSQSNLVCRLLLEKNSELVYASCTKVTVERSTSCC